MARVLYPTAAPRVSNPMDDLDLDFDSICVHALHRRLQVSLGCAPALLVLLPLLNARFF